jgi:hypothetical protein
VGPLPAWGWAARASTGCPLAELAAASFPKLVVSGGHSAGFDAICDDLAERIGAPRMWSRGAGHEIQFTGHPQRGAAHLVAHRLVVLSGPTFFLTRSGAEAEAVS